MRWDLLVLSALRETREHRASWEERDHLVLKEDKDPLAPAASLEKKEKLVYPVSLDLQDGTDGLGFEAFPDPLDLKEIMEKMESREKLVYRARRATREPRAIWDLSAVVGLGDRGEKLDRLDHRERKDHLGSWAGEVQRARMEHLE